MNQNKKKMMKSKLKYYAQVIGVNLLAFFVPVLAVILIYGIGKLKNIYSHPCVLLQEIYNCCLWAMIVVLAGFSVGLLLLGWADSWRKAKLFVLKSRREREKRELLHIKMEIEPIEERMEQKNTPAPDDSEFEDISGLTVKEIWELYKGREIALLADKIFIAGYDEESSLVVVGTKLPQNVSYDVMVESMTSKDPNKWHVEKGYANYGALSTEYIHIYKNRHQ